MASCDALTTPGTQWSNYCPSLAACIIFAILFGSTSIVHLIQAIRYRKKRLSWILIMGGMWETAAYVCRALAILMPTSEPIWDTQYALVLVAPLLVNAWCYLLLGRMVYFALSSGKLCGIAARMYAPLFVVCDICCFALQVVGILFTLSVDVPTINLGLEMYSIGVGVQQTFIAIFSLLLWRLAVNLRDERPEADEQVVAVTARLIRLLIISLSCISIRIVFRILEFAGGVGSPLTTTIQTHEAFAYVFDAIPMLGVFVAVNCMHPGITFVGPDSELPGRKQRRAAKREREVTEADAGDYVKLQEV